VSHELLRFLPGMTSAIVVVPVSRKHITTAEVSVEVSENVLQFLFLTRSYPFLPVDKYVDRFMAVPPRPRFDALREPAGTP
jgi:hypothetical protein